MKNKKLVLLMVLAVFLLIFICYSNVINAGFVFDDLKSILENKDIRSFQNIPQLYSEKPFRLLPMISFMFDFVLGKINPSVYHFTNIFFHFLTSITVYFFSFLLIGLIKKDYSQEKKLLYSFIVSALFAVHPIQTQAVSYISQRVSIFSTLFYLSALNIYILILRKVNKKFWKNIFNLKTLILFILLWTFQIFAHLSKENSFSFFLALIVINLVYYSDSIKNFFKSFVFVVPSFFLSFVVFVTRFHFFLERNISFGLPNASQRADFSRLEYFITQLRGFWTYLRLLFLPIYQNVDYDYPIFSTISNTEVLVSLVGIMVLIILAFILLKRYKLLSFGIFFFIIGLIIELSIIPIEDVINEHRLYLSSVGFFIFLVFFIDLLMNKISKSSFAADFFSKISSRYKVFVVFILLIILYIPTTYMRNIIWKNELSLWTDTVEKSPHKARVRNNLGTAYIKDSRFEEAITQFKIAIDLDENFLKAYNNMASSYGELGNLGQAIYWYRELIKRDNNNVLARYNLASLHARIRNYNEAIAEYKEILKIDDKFSPAYDGLGMVFVDRGEYAIAEDMFLKAIEVDPAYKNPYLNLSMLYENRGYPDLARQYLQKGENL